jgi:5-methylcytosine-specific restriction endonuclease McrA
MRPEYYSPEWFWLKEAVLARDGYTCGVCGGIAETAHHLDYRFGIICPMELLVAVCWRCHSGLLHGRSLRIREFSLN